MLPALIRRVPLPERGATAVEYALMVAFITIVIVASVLILGGRLKNLFSAAGVSI